MTEEANQPPTPAPPADPAVSQAAAPVAAPAQDPALAIRRSASWFYWIAGLSLINVLSIAGGAKFSMILGTGISQITQQLAQSYWETGASGAALALYSFTLLFIASFVLFGRKASQLAVWPFVVGMAIYAIDGLVFFLDADYVGIGFHVFVLFMLYRGMAALMRLKRAR